MRLQSDWTNDRRLHSDSDRHWRRIGCILALLACCASSAPVLAQQDDADDPLPVEESSEEEEFVFPKFEEMTYPEVSELLTGEPRDWIILKNGDVVVCEPLVPRPDTLALLLAEQEQKEQERIGKSGAELDRLSDEIDRLNYLEITIPELTENPEFRLHRQRIDRIMHHEDLMLERIDALLSAGDIPVGLELLARLERLWPEWPGLDRRHNLLLFVDAGQRQQAGLAHQSLVLLSELHGLTPDYPGLSQRMGEVVDTIVSAALDAGDYRQARYFLLNLAAKYNDHEVFRDHAGAMQGRTEQLLVDAAESQQAGRHEESAAMAAEAASLWPRTPNLLSRIRPFVERYQTLHVGVVQLPDFESPAPYPARAEQRLHGLTDRPLFALDRVRGGTTFYRTRYFDEWEPFDLGRRIHFTVSQVRQSWETRPVIDGPTFAAMLNELLSPASEHYDERFDAYVQSVRVVSPVEVTLTFDRVPARVEPLLSSLFPEGTSAALEAGVAGDVSDSAGRPGFVSIDDATGEGTQAPAGVGLQPVRSGDESDTLTYQRAIAEKDGLSQYHVAEVVEHRFDSHEKALQALQQGEISMLPVLPDWILRRVQNDEEFLKDFFIQSYALPRTHIVQINPASAPLRNGELRRAMIYALDRNAILRDTVLRDDEAMHGRIITSPFAANSYALSLEVDTPRAYDLSSAVALGLTAAQRLGGEIPPLKMLVPPGPVERAAADELIRFWKRIRVEVEPVAYSDAADVEWDLMYRTMHMAEPTVELWPFLTASNRARIEDLDVYPDWLKQELVALDRTSDWNRAVNKIQDLHQHLWSEALYIPLWEVDEFLIVRKNINGFPQSPIHCYQGIENWNVEAWYAAE